MRFFPRENTDFFDKMQIFSDKMRIFPPQNMDFFSDRIRIFSGQFGMDQNKSMPHNAITDVTTSTALVWF